MERNFPAFCHRQSTKMLDYAEHSTDSVLKDKFLQMSASWLKMALAPSSDTEAPSESPSRDSEQPMLKNVLDEAAS